MNNSIKILTLNLNRMFLKETYKWLLTNFLKVFNTISCQGNAN